MQHSLNICVNWMLFMLQVNVDVIFKSRYIQQLSAFEYNEDVKITLGTKLIKHSLNLLNLILLYNNKQKKTNFYFCIRKA